MSTSTGMTRLLVRGLDGEGPGDIVGAFVNEAGVDPDAIGDIEVDDGEATVAVADDAAPDVVAAMDGGRVGSAEVSVTRLDAETETVREYVEEYTRLVDLEREAEMRRHEREIRDLSGREREAKGRAVLDTRGRDEGDGLGGHLVKFVRDDGVPDTEISVGDLVMVSKRDPTREDNPTGTVTRVTGHSITLAFDAKPPGWVFDSGVRLDLYVNDVTFQRMQDALETLPDATGALAHLRDVVVGVDDPADDAPADVRDWHDEDLNDAQRAAVRRALGTEDVHLIHGPPGTGKTTTAVEVIRQAVDRGEAVLATAPSNTAVDNVLERLVAGGVDAVRVGHPARVTPTLREHTLDARVEEREAYQRAQEKREAAFELRDEQEALTAPSGRWRRGLSDSRIRDLAEKGQGARGVSAEKIAEMAEWLDYRERADALFEEAERLEDEAVAEVVASADVVCTTNATAGSDLLAGHEFDTLVLDEATQATEPGCLVPLVRADRAILAGDHRQLPPTIQSREAAEAGLRETLFERLAERHDGVVSLLDVQYRMHDAIAGFSSRCFYDGELTAPDAVATHTLADLLDADALPDARRPALAPEVPLAFVNTADIEAPERRREGSTSVENPTEADLVARLAEEYIAAGVAPADVAVISPYDDQVERLRGTLDYDGLEVDTVDGFQGREKEVVLVSLVRSNDEGRVGFLDEARRFNVALTRAKRKAVVVGDAETVTTADHYDAFRRYVRDREGAREVDAAALT